MQAINISSRWDSGYSWGISVATQLTRGCLGSLAGSLLFVLFAHPMQARQFEKDFAVVMLDAATEAKYGQIPIDRALFADAVRKLAAGGAKGVVLKFFFDKPRRAESDERLAEAFGLLPVILQAAIDDRETNANELPARFTLGDLKAPTEVSGKSGLIPLTIFSAKAHAVGFVDARPGKQPMIEDYRGRTVKSLVLCCMEFATGEMAKLETGKRIQFGGFDLQVDSKNQAAVEFPKTQELEYIPFHDLLTGSVAANAFSGKVVIIAYDGPNIHSIETSQGKVRAHKAFVLTLKSIYERLGK